MFSYRQTSLHIGTFDRKKKGTGSRRMNEAQKDFDEIKQFLKNLALIDTQASPLVTTANQLEKAFMAALQGTFRATPQFKQMREVQEPFTKFCNDLQDKLNVVKAQDTTFAIILSQQKLHQNIEKVNRAPPTTKRGQKEAKTYYNEINKILSKIDDAISENQTAEASNLLKQLKNDLLHKYEPFFRLSQLSKEIKTTLPDECRFTVCRLIALIDFATNGIEIPDEIEHIQEMITEISKKPTHEKKSSASSVADQASVKSATSATASPKPAGKPTKRSKSQPNIPQMLQPKSSTKATRATPAIPSMTKSTSPSKSTTSKAGTPVKTITSKPSSPLKTTSSKPSSPSKIAASKPTTPIKTATSKPNTPVKTGTSKTNTPSKQTTSNIPKPVPQTPPIYKGTKLGQGYEKKVTASAVVKDPSMAKQILPIAKSISTIPKIIPSSLLQMAFQDEGLSDKSDQSPLLLLSPPGSKHSDQGNVSQSHIDEYKQVLKNYSTILDLIDTNKILQSQQELFSSFKAQLALVYKSIQDNKVVGDDISSLNTLIPQIREEVQSTPITNGLFDQKISDMIQNMSQYTQTLQNKPDYQKQMSRTIRRLERLQNSDFSTPNTSTLELPKDETNEKYQTLKDEYRDLTKQLAKEKSSNRQLMDKSEARKKYINRLKNNYQKLVNALPKENCGDVKEILKRQENIISHLVSNN